MSQRDEWADVVGTSLPSFNDDVQTRAVCRNPVCRKPLYGTWDDDSGFCCECGLEYELFHPEERRQPADDDSYWPASKGAEHLEPRREAIAPRKLAAGLGPIRLGLKVLSAVAPAAAEEQAARMFFTPRRVPRRSMPAKLEAEATHFSLKVGGERIVGWSWGYGPTVLLVHGWEGYGVQLAHFVQPLVRSGLRAVMFDMPAHGGSTGREISAFDMSRAIRALAHAFSPARAAIAHSLGATALIVALSEGLELDRAVLVAPAAEPTHFARLLASLLGLSGRRTEGMLKQIELRVGRRLQEMNVVRLISGMQTEALIMHDPDDPEVPFAHGRAIAGAWPGAQLECLSGMGHRRMLRDGKVVDRTAAFLADVARPEDRLVFFPDSPSSAHLVS